MPINSIAYIKWKKKILEIQIAKVHSRRNNLNIISIKDIEFVVKNLPTKATPYSDGYNSRFYHLRKKSHNCTQTYPEYWGGQNIFQFIMWDQHYFDTKTKNITRNKISASISHKHRCKNSS